MTGVKHLQDEIKFLREEIGNKNEIIKKTLPEILIFKKKILQKAYHENWLIKLTKKWISNEKKIDNNIDNNINNTFVTHHIYAPVEIAGQNFNSSSRENLLQTEINTQNLRCNNDQLLSTRIKETETILQRCS